MSSSNWPRLVVDDPLRLVGRQLERVTDEARRAPEVERGEAGQQPFAIGARLVERDEAVVEAADPQVGAEAEVGRVVAELEVVDALELFGREHVGPDLLLRQPGLLEVVDELGVVDLDLLGRDDPLEAVLRDRVRALHAEPSVLVVAGQLEQRADDLAEHRSQVGRGVLGVVDLRAEPSLAHREALVDRRVRHPDVDPEARGEVVERVELEVARHEVTGDREVAADRLADARPVQRAGQRIADVVRDRAVVLVARVHRRHEVVAALEDRSGQKLDPLGHDRAQVGVDHDHGLDLELARHLEQGAHRGALAARALVGDADALELVLRADQDHLLEVVRALGADRDARRVVRRAAVAVDEDRLELGEVLDHPRGRGAHDVADRLGVAEGWDADHEVGVADAPDLGQPIGIQRRWRSCGRVGGQGGASSNVRRPVAARTPMVAPPRPC